MELGQLMSRIAAGDKAAFRDLYTQYNQTVYKIALSKTGEKDAAMDVVKNVFKTVYKTLCRAPYEGDFMVWLNALIDTELNYRQRTASMSAAASRTEAKRVSPVPLPPAPSVQVVCQPPQQPVYAPPMQPEYKQPAVEAAAYVPNVIDCAAARDMGGYRAYTNEEAAALSARADAVVEEEEEAPAREKKGFGYYFLTLLGFAGSLVLLWMLAGLLMRLNILPSFDLGYAWFNEAMFPLF